MTNEAAAIKLAERDNLVGELVEALETLVDAYEGVISSEFGTIDCPNPFTHAPEVIAARTAIAKAREGAQS